MEIELYEGSTMYDNIVHPNHNIVKRELSEIITEINRILFISQSGNKNPKHTVLSIDKITRTLNPIKELIKELIQNRVIIEELLTKEMQINTSDSKIKSKDMLKHFFDYLMEKGLFDNIAQTELSDVIGRLGKLSRKTEGIKII